MKTGVWKSGLKVAAATVAYAGIHSLLASRWAKSQADRLVGQRNRAAYYRAFYLGQSLVTFAALYGYSRTLPDKTLYHVRGPAARAMNAGQLAGLVYAAWAARSVGIQDILGIREVSDGAKGKRKIRPEPEAQGPSADSSSMQVTGPFRWSRHPLNFAPLPIFWLMPKMTVQLLSYNVAMTAYMVVGSIHEEHRLEKAYRDKYREYQRSGVPFYIPRPWKAA